MGERGGRVPDEELLDHVSFDHHPGIGGEALLERIWLTDKGCFCCPTPCGKYSLTKVNSKSAYVEGPEYETVALIGGNCMLRTIEEVAYGNYLCDELGLDTISGGNVVAFALECFERGIITEEQVGRKVEWGDIDSFEHLVRAIAYREGIGGRAGRWGEGCCRGLRRRLGEVRHPRQGA